MTTDQKKIRLGIPKGSLEESTLSLFAQAGLEFTGASRSLWLNSNDSEIEPVLLRPQEIPIYVESGRLDAGLAGLDWIAERNVEDRVVRLADLTYAKQTLKPVRWVLAVPEASAVMDVADLRDETGRRADEGEPPLVVSTELQRLSSRWLAERGIDADVQFSWGATEAKAGYFSDAIIEATETGSSLRANGLRIIGEVFISTTQFFANRDAYRRDAWKRAKLTGLAHMLAGALHAEEMVQLTVVADHELFLEEFIPPAHSLMHTSFPNGPAGEFHAVLVLPKDMVAQVLPALIDKGARGAWTAPIGLLYEKGLDINGA